MILSAPTLLTIFERQSIPYPTLGLTANHPLLDALEKLNQASGVEVIRVERKGLRVRQYVGVIQAGEHLIQILPKIDFDPNGLADAPNDSSVHQRAASSAARNLMHLLCHARSLKLHPQTLAALHTGSGNWLEMLTRLFCIELTRQLQQGFHQDYVRRDDLLPYLRGRWNIARQFVRQPNLAQGLNVSYDEYSPDTALNRIFKLAVKNLQQVTADGASRQMLADLETWLLPVQVPAHISSAALDRVEFNRLNERFLPAFQLARLFLEGQSIQLLAGGQRAYAFVFDMDKLFEQFVAGLLQSQSRRILPEAWAGCQIERQGGQAARYLVQAPGPSEDPLFQLKPDLLLHAMGAPFLIIDTKNKALPPVNPHRAVSQQDAYQMLAYATRFRCPNILLLYPRSFGAAPSAPVCLHIEGTPIQLFVATLDLHQPLENLDQLIRDFRGILQYIQMRTFTAEHAENAEKNLF